MLFILLSLTACKETNQEEKIELNSASDRLAYALGADHARSISESGDPYFSRYNVDEIVKGFEIGLKDEKAFDDAKVKLVTLTDYEHVVAEALETGYIAQDDVEVLHQWRKDPANWNK